MMIGILYDEKLFILRFDLFWWILFIFYVYYVFLICRKLFELFSYVVVLVELIWFIIFSKRDIFRYGEYFCWYDIFFYLEVRVIFY